MRTNIEIDDKLMKEAMRSANTKAKKETVEAGLRMLIQVKGHGRLLNVLDMQS